MKKNIALLVAAVALVLGVGAAGLAVSANLFESTDEAKADLCESLYDFGATVESYQGLNLATATNDELESARDDIEDAWNEVEDDAYDWYYAYDNELTEAYDDLYYAIQDLDGDLTISESIEALEPELSALPQAYADTLDGSGCSTDDEE